MSTPPSTGTATAAVTWVGNATGRSEPLPPTRIVASNVRALRKERRWSQRVLANRITDLGMVTWSGSTVALVENGQKRVDHLLELAALCQVFQVPLARLMAGDVNVPVITSGKAAAPLERIRLALSGTAADDEVATLPDQEQPWDTTPVTRALGINPQQLDALTYDAWQDWSFTRIRDARAGIDPFSLLNISQPTQAVLDSARAKRGHASRALIAELRAHLEEVGGIDVVWERTRQAWAEERESMRHHERQSIAQQWAQDTGEWPTDEELDDYLKEQS